MSTLYTPCCHKFRGRLTHPLLVGNACGSHCELTTLPLPTVVREVWQQAVDTCGDGDHVVAYRHDDGHWTVGSNYEDKSYCLAFYPDLGPSGQWFRRECWSGDDSPLPYDPVKEIRRLFS